MDALKEEIARKKRQLEEKAVMVPDKKYFKRGDLSAKEAEEYFRKIKRLTCQTQDDGPSSSKLGDDSEDSESREPTEDDTKKAQLPRKEVIRRLRERDEPIRVFGESDYEAFQRLRKLEMLEPEVNKGFQNDFQDAMDRVDQDELNEMLKSTGAVDTDDTTVADVKVKSDGTTYEEIMSLKETFGKGDESLDCEVILKFLKLILNIWGEELNTRPEAVKRTMKGKYVSATHMQTVSYIKPLFRKLKREEVQTDILSCLVDIVRQLLDRHYLKANEAYLEMAIGNAPWPIGVTMVGIHARTGREKIFARNVAHVLNDETQRKYIQGLKRLMTQAQKYFPTDPSKCVNFEAPKP
jgi:pre-mRNA-splicing factor 18